MSLTSSSSCPPVVSTTWNDAFVNPTPFSGKSQEDPKSWYTYLERWTRYKNITEEQLLRMFPLLFRGLALDWWEGLGDNAKDSVAAVKHQFQNRFYDSALEQWKWMAELWKTKQGPKETVKEYVDRLQKIKRSCEVISDDNLQCAIIMGWRPDIKRHVIQQAPTSMEAVIRAAKLAEQAYIASDDNDNGIAAAISRIEPRLFQTEIRNRSPLPAAGDNRYPRHEFRSVSVGRVEDDRASQNPSEQAFRSRNTSRDHSETRGRFQSKSPNRVQFQEQSNMNFATRGNWTNSRNQNTGKRGYNCGRIGHLACFCKSQQTFSLNRANTSFSNSRFSNIVCFTCKRRGHLARMCRSAQASPSN